VLGTGLKCDAADCVSYRELPERILRGPADLIVFSLGSQPAATLPFLRKTTTQTKVPIVAIGSTSNPEEILQALRSGAREYLHESELGEGLLATLIKMRENGAAALEWGKILAVIAAKPGIGVTTVACNLAFALASHHPRRVALAELGLQVPELALHLDVQPQHELNELAIRAGRMDTTLLRQLMVEHSARLNLLVHQQTTPQAAALPPRVMRTVLVLLRTMFEYTVVDLGHLANPADLSALELASKVIVVVALDVPTLRLTRRFLRDLDDAGVPQRRLVVVANRYGQSSQFPWKQAQEALGLQINEWIPDDAALINQALNLGQPLVTLAPRAGITRRFDQLANRVNGKQRGK
jgi:pilus assembly protein CpaE